MTTETEPGLLDAVQLGDVLFVTTPVARYLAEVDKVGPEFVRTKNGVHFRRTDGVCRGSETVTAVPANADAAKHLRAEQWLRRGNYETNPEQIIQAAKLLGWNDSK